MRRVAFLLLGAALLASCKTAGKAGAAARVTITTPDGQTRDLPGKGAFPAPAGSVIDMLTPGSGGFGDPFQNRSLPVAAR